MGAEESKVCDCGMCNTLDESLGLDERDVEPLDISEVCERVYHYNPIDECMEKGRSLSTLNMAQPRTQVDNFTNDFQSLEKLNMLHEDCIYYLQDKLDQAYYKDYLKLEEKIKRTEIYMKKIHEAPVKIRDVDVFRRRMLTMLARIGIPCSGQQLVDAGSALVNLTENPEAEEAIQKFVCEVINVYWELADLSCVKKYCWSDQDMQSIVTFQKICEGWLRKSLQPNLKYQDVHQMSSSCITRALMMLFYVIQCSLIGW